VKAFGIIDLFGGPTRLSNDLGLPLSTVHRWGRANYIPEWRQPKLLELAVERHIALSVRDFPSVEERKSLAKDAA
jgi:hypothetical protein